MALSLRKLQRLLENKRLVLQRYFTIKGMCVYIEVLIVETADIFFLYIPSKYDIKAPKSPSTFKIANIDINEDGTIAGDYAGELDNVELEKTYEEVNIDITHGENLEDQLENSYNHPLSLKDINKNEMKILREIFRQLKRLRLCVQSLKYKLCITYKNYLCCSAY
jgi:transposase